MGQDPEEIEREIQETRERMGERVDALSYKADVKSRVGDSIADKRDNLVGKVKGLMPGGSDESPSGPDVKDRATGRVKGLISKGSERAPSREDLTQQAQRARGIAQNNPLGLAVGAVAAGFLIGLLLPSTRMEDEKLGQAADTIKDKAAETGHEALERGKQVAQDVAQTAKETAQESGNQHAGELSETAQQKASEAADEARSQVQG
jgi:hypothetical protein